MKLAEKVLKSMGEALDKDDLDTVRKEIESTDTLQDIVDMRNFSNFYAEYEKNWDAKKWMPYFKAVYDEQIRQSKSTPRSMWRK